MKKLLCIFFTFCMTTIATCCTHITNKTNLQGKWMCGNQTLLQITNDSILITDVLTDETDVYQYVVNKHNNLMTWIDALGYENKVTFQLTNKNNKLLIKYHNNMDDTPTYVFNRFKPKS